MTEQEMADEVRRLSRQLDGALSFLKDQIHAYANAEAEYRQSRARLWVSVEGKTAKEREAQVDGESALLRRDRDIAEGMKQASLEAIRSRRTQISAFQTLMNVQRSEAEFVRTGVGP